MLRRRRGTKSLKQPASLIAISLILFVSGCAVHDSLLGVGPLNAPGVTYKYIAAGKFGETPSSALLAPSAISTSHPYFWAPFILVGDGK